jgi:hypothetical protein
LRRNASSRCSDLELGVTRARRRRIASLGVFIILFQAILFGWHTHPLPLASRGALMVSAAPAGSLPALADTDDCDICAALHHHGAAPIEFAALTVPPITAERVYAFTLALLARAPSRGFQARAPPRA